MNFRWKNMLCNTQFLLIMLFVLKKKFSLYFVLFISWFFKLETSLNESTFDQLDFVKTQNFDSNDVVVMSYDVISLSTRWNDHTFSYGST